jgi:lipid II:glycine glycyltransferase (peptidoglycan interpeptide bridge formation enzyme)
MGNNHASSQYFFSDRYFRQLRKALGANIHLMFTRHEGQVASAGLFIESNGSMHAHLAGVNEQFRRLSPLKILLDDVRRWARERGNALLHLGGGRGGRDDSLFAFKARFSPRRHQFYTGQWIVNRAAHNLLCKERQAYASKAGLVLLNPEFFPTYRGPLGKAPGPEPATISSVSGTVGCVAMEK